MKIGKIIRKIAMLLSLVMLVTSAIGTTYCYIETQTDPITNVFVPDTAGASCLTIKKTVEHPLGENYAIPNNINFAFDIELGSYYAGAKLNTTAGEKIFDENGTLNVLLSPGVPFGIEGIEEGTIVKVTEKTTTLSGFKVEGNATKTVTVGSDGIVNISFVNIYNPESVKPSNISVGGIKILEGRQWEKGDSFTFLLEQKKAEKWSKIGEQTVFFDEKKADFNIFDFNNVLEALEFDKIGTYVFRMSEIIGTLENVDYDKTVNYFTIKVTDVDMDGKLEINSVTGTENVKVTKTDARYNVYVTFNNKFIPPAVAEPDPVTVQVNVDKIINNTGKTLHGKGGFQFVLKNIENTEEMCATSDDNGKASFSLNFTKADIGKTYIYKLSEKNQGLAGMTYDTNIHEVAITVFLNENNKLVTATKMDGKSTDTLNATFENTYDSDITVTPPTEDDSNLMLWFILMIMSGAALIVLVVYDRKHRLA